MFRDRTDAGERLAELLVQRGVEADVVLAVPRGGLPIGRAVADALSVPLDVIVARKLGAPGNAELAIGAAASDGTVWLNDPLIERLGIDSEYVERERTEQAAAARKKAERYRGDKPVPDLDGKRVLIVDDGIATGATIIACLRQAYAAGAERVVLAVPVASPDVVEHLSTEADEVVAAETPPNFNAVGQFYASFAQVSDEEAISYLDE